MESDTSTAGFGIPYEYVVKQAQNGRLIFLRAVLIVFYVLWTVGNVAVVLLHKNLFALIAVVLPLSLWLLIRFTWRRTYVEYEYSIFGGVLTVSRILGGKSRKELVSVTLRNLAMVIPYDDAHFQPIVNFDARKKMFAVSSMDAAVIYALLWKEGDERRLLCIEPDERLIKLIKHHNIAAFRG